MYSILDFLSKSVQIVCNLSIAITFGSSISTFSSCYLDNAHILSLKSHCEVYLIYSVSGKLHMKLHWNIFLAQNSDGKLNIDRIHTFSFLPRKTNGKSLNAGKKVWMLSLKVRKSQRFFSCLQFLQKPTYLAYKKWSNRKKER